MQTYSVCGCGKDRYVGRLQGTLYSVQIFHALFPPPFSVEYMNEDTYTDKPVAKLGVTYVLY